MLRKAHPPLPPGSASYLLFCFHRSSCSPVGEYHLAPDLLVTRAFLFLYEILQGINGFLKPSQTFTLKKNEKCKCNHSRPDVTEVLALLLSTRPLLRRGSRQARQQLTIRLSYLSSPGIAISLLQPETRALQQFGNRDFP